MYNPDTEEWDFVPSGEFPKVDPSKLDGWYEYDPNTQ